MEGGGELTAYEQERQRRLEENRRKLEEMGLQQMVTDMAQAGGEQAAKKRREKKAAPEVPLEPSRRSSRNEGKVVSYRFEEERGPPRPPRDGPLVKDGECEEVYGEAHVLALGSYTKEWEMFTDGYDPASGERIYDPDNGKSCHQCRQKTLGLRTTCSRCKSGLGQLCGDCLFARYGEHVEEVAEKLDWVCPCCRDLCNCSTHRKKKKWEATGQLHRSVKARGYLSVAHYLVLNKAGGLAAKRAALATGFCPPDLAAKLRADIKQLEEEAAERAARGEPEPEEQLATAEQAAAEQAAVEQQGKGGKAAGRKSGKRASSGGGKKGAAAAAGEGQQEGEGQQAAPKRRNSAGKGKKAAAAAAGEEGAEQPLAAEAEADAALTAAIAAASKPTSGRKRGSLPGSGTLEGVVAAPARRRRSSAARQ
ncbi:Cell division cycle-associated 7 [Chlorella sorokiniana]|uniref:Cell division cycle-associated 7 n=1 Tax=Chlorella sorokiniana TaxID=3076 RepID=A0A2P6TX40_CHLSO|nr:Cell division cycle-associated 7 [Chlorella sorokiniana]|eukprot:PRW58633.1 Cell division cycle-associated 7 [Chlorella sorokiniana]